MPETSWPGGGADRSFTFFVDFWTNPVNPFDVNNQGGVTALDVLEIINHINTNPSDSTPPATQFAAPRFFDTSSDGIISALDVLMVINYVNAHPTGSGEGEMAAPTAEVASLPRLVGAPFGAAVAMFPAAAEHWTEAASTALGKEFPLPAWLQGTSPREEARRMQVPVGSAAEYHFADTLLDDHGLFELDGVLRDIAPEIAKCNHRG